MSDLHLSDVVSIIGKECQTLQIVLKKNEKINVNKKYILYASSDELDEIQYSKVDSLINQNLTNSSSLFFSNSKEERLKKVNIDSIVRLKNKKDNYEYVGLTMGGKIMKIIPILYQNLYVKVDNILVFNEGIELLQDKERDERINKVFQQNIFRRGVGINMNQPILGLGNNFNNKNQFCLIRTKFTSNSNYLSNSENNGNINSFTNYFLKQNFEGVSLVNISSYNGDYLYLSGKKNLIEKRLGDNENMILMNNSLVAFESSVSFIKLKKEQNLKYVNHTCDIVAEGPGLIIFEQYNRPLPLASPANGGKIIAFLFIIIIIEIILQLFISNNMFNIVEVV